jgi:hypothetical protein
MITCDWSSDVCSSDLFLLLGPLLVLCWRAGRWRQFGTALVGAVVAWLVVNLPVMLFAFDGWSKFYTFSQERGVDFGSFWLIWTQNSSNPPSTDSVNTMATLLMLVCCAGIAALALTAPRRPRFAQLAFLIVAAFILTNKVYSPQYGLWLLPWFALTAPGLGRFAAFAATDLAVFVTRFAFFGQRDPQIGGWVDAVTIGWFQLALAARALVLVWYLAQWVRTPAAPGVDVPSMRPRRRPAVEAAP